MKKLPVFICIAALAACGGGSDSDSDESDSGGTAALTGVFLDSPVAGMTYKTETQSGTTNADGEFNFLEGETITFSIGEVEFPSGQAGETVTPIDLAADAATAETKENEVVNILRLLQTLDTDGNPDNGITISEDAAAAATEAVDFAVPTTEFERNDAVVALVTDGGQIVPVTALVSEQSATEHFEEQLSNNLAGTWLLDNPSDSTDYNVVFYMEDGRYFVGHTKNREPVNPDAPEDEQVALAVSGEYGTYEWDVVSGKAIVTSIADSDGEGGITEQAPGTAEVPLKISGDTMIITDAGERLEISRVSSDTSGIVGSWLYEPNPSSGTDYNIFVFIEDGRYFIGHTKNTEPVNPDDPEADWVIHSVSGEYGTYTWNAETGHFQATRIGQSDGEGGITESSSSITATLTISADGLTLLASGEALAKRVGK